MNSQLSANNYKVYKHTCPNGKVYIGITRLNPLDRWGGGFGYQTQVYFWRAIVKYGWINIKHDVPYDNLSEEEAKQKAAEAKKKAEEEAKKKADAAKKALEEQKRNAVQKAVTNTPVPVPNDSSTVADSLKAVDTQKREE